MSYINLRRRMVNKPVISQTSSMVDVSQDSDTSAPLLRVYAFGAFRLDWQVPPFTAVDIWKSRTSARTLFKLLLCAPGRQASRSQLAGILWPETDEDKARESLRSASKVLRKVLRAASGEELLENRNNSTVLKLAEQSSLWVDADAFEDLISLAGRAVTPDEALALWQQAKTLLRGEFLADDLGSEWIGNRWIKMRRQALRMARCRMIHHLADIYVQGGQFNLAEEVLAQHIIRFPTDQDALYRLLLLLERQGCFEEAHLLYERTRRILEAAGKQPAKHVSTHYEQLRNVANAQERPANYALLTGVPEIPLLLEYAKERVAGDRLQPPQAPTEYTSNGPTPELFNLAIEMLWLVQQQQSWSCNELLSSIELALGRSDGMSPLALSRRQALALFVNLPAGLLGMMELGKHIATEEVLFLCGNVPPRLLGPVLARSIAGSGKGTSNLLLTIAPSCARVLTFWKKCGPPCISNASDRLASCPGAGRFWDIARTLQARVSLRRTRRRSQPAGGITHPAGQYPVLPQASCPNLTDLSGSAPVYSGSISPATRAHLLRAGICPGHAWAKTRGAALARTCPGDLPGTARRRPGLSLHLYESLHPVLE